MPQNAGNILLLIFATCCITDYVTGSPQYIAFYQEYGCVGSSDTIFDSRDDLNSSRIGTSSSLLIKGLWKVTVYKRMSESQLSGYTIIHYNTQPPDGRCVNKTEWNLGEGDIENYFMYYAERLGDGDMAASQVVFFTEPEFSGLRYTVKNESVEQVAPGPFAMLSYLHFSNETWVVYPETNLTGKPTYLRPTAQNVSSGAVVYPADSFSYNSSTVLIVGSVRKGEHDEGIVKDKEGVGSKEIANVAAILSALVLSYFLF